LFADIEQAIDRRAAVEKERRADQREDAAPRRSDR
jgi:hypothetical protein